MADSTSPQPAPNSALPEGLSADSIDTLPVLAALLSRLQNHLPSSTALGSPPVATPSQLTSGSTAITIKDIPAATDGLKHKLQRARAQVMQLPDMQRSIAEQEEEIQTLEERIKTQKAVLANLRDAGSRTKSIRVAGQSEAC